MADFYPDPDEEYELLHADEFEVIDEFDQENYIPPDIKNPPNSKKSLDFTSPGHIKKSLDTSSLASPLSDESVLQKANASQLLFEDIPNEKEIDNSCMIENGLVDEEEVVSAENTEVNGKKRKVEELFGDIDDIDFGDDFDEVSTKRTKTGLENDEKEILTDEQRMNITIQKILAARQQLKENNDPLPQRCNNKLSFENKLALEITRRVPNHQFVSMNLQYGEKIYLRLRTEDAFNSEVDDVSKQIRSGGLLSLPFKNIQTEAALLLQKKWDSIEKDVVNSKTNDNTKMDVSTESVEGELWVEKYRPKRYIDLLSDEGTNKSLLKWIKLWDKVVFNKENKIKIKQKYEEKGKFGGKFKKKAAENELDDELDELGRPKFKMALLCGPPGLGKTTLAHILARHAGYNVVEVNASDDRSPELFRTQLQAATQMKSVMGKNPRPNCLVLDEIDGAPQASIEVLVKFSIAKEAVKGKGMKKKKSDLSGVLKRPIICICNDVYVPALRPLRQVAYVLHFPPTCSYRLAQRLCEISRLQNLKTDLGTMMALSEKSNNDIRACLALLHCLQTKSGNVIKLAQINNTTVGTKDIQKGLFTVWQEIFQIKNSDRWKSVLQTVQGCGDYDRLAQGVYENYLMLKLKGSSLKSISEGLDWFIHYDIMSSSIHVTQNYTAYAYLAYPFLKWHFLFAGRIWPKLTFPSLGYELMTKTTRTQGLLDEMLRGMSPTVRPYERRETLLLDVIALLLEIIVPNLRPVSVQLYSDEEKKDLNKVVNVMLDYNLSYTQERSQEGNYVFKLDPNMEEVAKFPGSKSQRILGYAGRQQIQREIDLERVRRVEASMNQYKSTDSNQPVAVKNNNVMEVSKPVSIPQKKEPKPKSLPNHLQTLTPKILKKPSESLCKDFFGRIIEKQNNSEDDGGPVLGKDIWFKFKEGYNNAVRLRVNMSDLF
ncbi:chromosome transmission fidelity protein 18 homolog [Lycorma delicatula]|uniref:chromosome transmission fidelity protein 18 homolog n=1 Tax=Lycorma delicatula TaxID=130591 RepID=UPI003F519AEB